MGVIEKYIFIIRVVLKESGDGNFFNINIFICLFYVERELV